MSTSSPLDALPQDVWQRPFVTTHEKWCGDFVLELRLRDVRGPVIGERLAEVEQHCAETGETPSEAFGDPTGYAARIEADSSPERTSGVRTIAVVSAAQVVALLVGTAAVGVWARGDALTYDLGEVVSLGLVVLLLLSLPRMLPVLLRHPWAFGLPLVAVVLLGVGGPVLSGRLDLPVAARLPAPVVATVLFLAVLVLAWVEYRELARDADGERVTSPLAAVPGRSGTTARRARRAALAPACLIPVAYVVLSAVGWSLSR